MISFPMGRWFDVFKAFGLSVTDCYVSLSNSVDIQFFFFFLFDEFNYTGKKGSYRNNFNFLRSSMNILVRRNQIIYFILWICGPSPLAQLRVKMYKKNKVIQLRLYFQHLWVKAMSYIILYWIHLIIVCGQMPLTYSSKV